MKRTRLILGFGAIIPIATLGFMLARPRGYAFVPAGLSPVLVERLRSGDDLTTFSFRGSFDNVYSAVRSDHGRAQILEFISAKTPRRAVVRPPNGAIAMISVDEDTQTTPGGVRFGPYAKGWVSVSVVERNPTMVQRLLRLVGL